MASWEFMLALLLLSADASKKNGHHKSQILSGARIFNGTNVKQEDFPFLVALQDNEGDPSKEKWKTVGSGTIVSPTAVLTACHVIADIPDGPDRSPKPIKETPPPTAKVTCTKISNDRITEPFPWNMTCIQEVPGKYAISCKFKRDKLTKVTPHDHKRYRIFAGTGNDLREPTGFGQYRAVTSIVPHPKCSKLGAGDSDAWTANDVGLLKLNQPLEFNGFIKPIKIFSHDYQEAIEKTRQMVDEGSSCQVVGWGKTRGGAPKSSDILYKADVKLTYKNYGFDPYNCMSQFNDHSAICAYSDHQGVCPGDSGGPLVCDGFLYGILSAGNCGPGQSSRYAHLSPITHMIKFFVGDYDSSQ